MLQYLVILLDDTSASFCHYANPRTVRRLMPIGTLREGIRWAMRKNLMIQFVYPDYALPEEHRALIETIDHSKIVPAGFQEEADVLVTDGWDALPVKADVPVVLRTSVADFLNRHKELVPLLGNVPRLNVVFTDVERFDETARSAYSEALDEVADAMEKMFVDGKSPQLNLLTDRMMLKEMNNCGAGDTTLTLAPNGQLYVCPAFYLDDDADSLGEPQDELSLPNGQLYKLNHAPICSHCDAYQCKRCVWLNRRLTLEVNTPSHQQCVMAHTERNASRRLLNNVRKHGEFLPEQGEIKELDYLDPFEKRESF